MTTTTEKRNLLLTGIQEINKVNVLTDRVIKRKEDYLAAKVHICPERSRLVTQSWKETEGEPVVLRRAKLFQKMLQGMSVVIREGELIVGSQTRFIRGASPCIDYSAKVVRDTLNAELVTSTGEMVEAVLTEEDRKSLLEDLHYWNGRSPGEILEKQVLEIMGEELADYTEARLTAGQFDRPCTMRGQSTKLIRKGLNGVLAEIREELENLDLSSRGNWQKLQFLKAGIICAEAAIEFAGRYATLARSMAEKEEDKVRKLELEKIAANCEWVPANPARTFHEALQSFWFIHLLLNQEVATAGVVCGRMDQYLFPLYSKDISEGRMTRQEAAELLGCLWVKLNEIDEVKSALEKQRSQSSQFQDATIGGVTTDGKDATNELSFMLLEVTRQIKMPQPPLYLRYHKNINDALLVKAIEVNREHGAGNPAFINDAVTIGKLMERGIPLSVARDYAATGCVGANMIDTSNGCDPVPLNKVKAFELALYNGIDHRTGKQIGPATGDPRNFKSYDELYTAFISQVEHIAKIAVKIYRLAAQARTEVFCQPFASILVDDCIKKGLCYQQGGVRYPQLSICISDVGYQNIADSLTAIKKLVFEEKKISMGEILDAISVNFEGKEKIRQMLLTAPKYGNDDDYADAIFNSVSLDSTRLIAQYSDFAGYPMYILRGGGAAHYWAGVTIGALPDGRKAYEPTADANLSPVQGMDVRGPSAVLLSATKVNQTEYAMTTLLNMKIIPTIVRSQEGIRKVLSLIKTFFDRGGWHIQFNMIDHEMLRDAKKHPEKYRNLLVRVAGYSAYFVELSPQVQDEIISRTEHSF